MPLRDVTVDLTSSYFVTDTTANYTVTDITYGGNETTTDDLTSMVTTGSSAPTLITPWLNSTQDLVVYASVITGVLGFILLLGILGWILDQAGTFGDPVASKIRKIYQNTRTEDLVNPFGSFPHARLDPNDPNVPSWMVHSSRISRGEDNAGYDPVDQSLQAHHAAVGEFEEIRSHMPDDAITSSAPHDTGGEQSSPKPVRPSAIAAYERKSKRKDNQDFQENAHYAKVARSPTTPRSTVPKSPTVSEYFREAETNMYQ